MKKYIPWIIGGVFVIASLATTLFLIFNDDNSSSDEDLSALDEIRPIDMKIEDVDSKSFRVVWKTKIETAGYIKYGNTSNSLSLIAQDVNGTDARKEHEVIVMDLSEGKKYYFYVMSDNVAFGRDGRPLEVLTISDL
jgi:hypothetical protein